MQAHALLKGAYYINSTEKYAKRHADVCTGPCVFCRRNPGSHRVEQRQHAVRRVPQRVRHAVEAAVIPDQSPRIEGFEVQMLVVQDRLWQAAITSEVMRSPRSSKVQRPARG